VVELILLLEREASTVEGRCEAWIQLDGFVEVLDRAAP
jgi:hypothetical protein